MFVHRDLAARNILVADDNTCKVWIFTNCGSLILFGNVDSGFWNGQRFGRRQLLHFTWREDSH